MKLLILRFSSLLFLAMVITLVSSCDKDDPAPDKEALLVGKTWIAVKHEMDGVDITDDMAECAADNTFAFFSDGTYFVDISNTTCEEFETDTEGTWTFKTNQTVLSLHPEGEDPSDLKILELTDKTMKLSQYVEMLDTEIVVTMAPL